MKTKQMMKIAVIFTDDRDKWSSMVVVDPRDVPQVHFNVPRHIRHVMLEPFHCRQEVLKKSEQSVNTRNTRGVQTTDN